jgi:hypothetical protein
VQSSRTGRRWVEMPSLDPRPPERRPIPVRGWHGAQGLAGCLADRGVSPRIRKVLAAKSTERTYGVGVSGSS